MGTAARAMTERIDELVSVCQDFVRAMGRTEVSLLAFGDALSEEEWSEALERVLRWIQETPELPPNSFTRELAREIIGQMTAGVMLRDYQGSADTYIQ